MTRIPARAALVGALSLLALAPRARAETLAERVNAAIDKGIAWLRGEQNADGSFKSEHNERWPGGPTALALYTLVKSGVANDDPAVVNAITHLKYLQWTRTYSTGVTILALDALKEKQHDPWIRSGAKWLEDHVNPISHTWGYPDGDPDLSNSQYAALGLWIAAKHGYKSKPDTWTLLVKQLLRFHFNDDGGFGYRPGNESTGSMTTAGIAVLSIAREQLEGDGRFRRDVASIDDALKKAWGWMDRRFAVEGNPQGGKVLTRNWHQYYLYGLERAAALGDKKEIGGTDWYKTGAEFLVPSQEAGGKWGKIDESCFALLFLRKATFSGLDKHDSEDGAGGGLDDEAAPAIEKPKDDVGFVRRWLVNGPLDDPKDTLLDADLFDVEKATPTRKSTLQGKPWKTYASPCGVIDFDAAVGTPGDHCIFHAFTWLIAKSECDAVIWLGHDDGGRLFLDGKEVHSKRFLEGAEADRYKVPVLLTAGPHRLLARVWDSGGLSTLVLRVAAQNGEPIPDLYPSLSPELDDVAETARAQPDFFSLAELREFLPQDQRLTLEFKNAPDMERVCVRHARSDTPLFIESTQQLSGYGPNPGARGVLKVHCAGVSYPAQVIRRVKLPPGKSSFRVRASGEAVAALKMADFRLRMLVFDGTEHVLVDEVVGNDEQRSEKNWRTFEADVSRFGGQDVLMIVECGSGGVLPWNFEHAYLDEASVVH